MANWATEIRIRAERKLGEMLKAQKDSGGMAKPGPKDSSHHASELPPKLSDLGISHSMSSRAQAIASVPEAEFERTIAEHREQQTEPTSATLYCNGIMHRYTVTQAWRTGLRKSGSALNVDMGKCAKNHRRIRVGVVKITCSTMKQVICQPLARQFTGSQRRVFSASSHSWPSGLAWPGCPWRH